MKGWLAAWVLCLLARPVMALPERTVSFDLGVGVPELVALHTQVQAMPRWQVGLGYSYLPGGSVLGQTFRFRERQVSLADGKSYTLTPQVTPTALYLTPFLRFFTGRSNFYFQASYAFFRLKGRVTSGVKDSATGSELLGALVHADVAVTQFLPTLGIGHIFGGQAYYFNVFLGAAWFGGVKTNATIATLLPDSVGGNAANQAEFEKAKAELQAEAERAIQDVRRQFPVVPSLHVAFGIFL